MLLFLPLLLLFLRLVLLVLGVLACCRSQPGFDSAFVMNVDDEDGQQQYMGYVQFESPQAAAAAQKVRP